MESLIHQGLPHAHRRSFLKLGAVAGLSWLTPVGQLLAAQSEHTREPAQSIILLWMNGGPSQLETFDPHPNTMSAGGTKAIDTAVKGVQLAEGYERLAEVMSHLALVRSMVSKEGDHERGTYLLKTGYRPNATVEHPSIGAICCHQLPVGKTEIPRHISILPSRWPSRGGFLGPEFDAFQADDPLQKLADVTAHVPKDRDTLRVKDLDVIEQTFLRGRQRRVEATSHREAVQRARTMMSSEQLKAFDVTQEPLQVRKDYGEDGFGRACLAARRLVEVGVRCVEVTLDGWDAHVNNHEIHKNRAGTLDPAFSSLIRDLKQRDLLDRTVVICAGEFGRTPKVNVAGGRDHWPNGFSIALAGGGIRGGFVLGATDPEGIKGPETPTDVSDIHATVLKAVGLDPTRENVSPVGRPIKLSEGKPIESLLV